MNSEPAKPDLRVKRSRKPLRDALMSLIEEKKFDAISVQEICDRAMVHRTTFYKHYEDKDGLLRCIVQENSGELVANFPALDVALDNCSYDKSPQHLIQVFIHIAKYKTFYKAMLTGAGVGVFRSFLKDQLVQWVLLRMQPISNKNSSLPVPEVILAQFMVGAVINVMTWWLEQDMPYSPEQMALYVMRLSLYGEYPVVSFDAQKEPK